MLEAGIGSGRLALPIAKRGLDVTGVDASEAMLDLLRAKPGSEAVTLIKGDMIDPAWARAGDVFLDSCGF